MKPEVTIVMATFNRAHFIEETLDSIKAQSFSNWECLIIDDGSTDKTATILSPYLLNDTRFKYYKRPITHKKGLPGCRNYGLKLAKGNFIIFFDDDDIVHPDNLLHCTNALKNPLYDFCRYVREVFTGTLNIQFDRSNKFSSFFISVKDISRILKHELPFNSCAIMWKKECFNKEKFNENLLYAEEWELYQRIIANGAHGVSLTKTLFYGRKHIHSNTGEFYNNDPVRKASKAEAIKLVASNLARKNLLTLELTRYFIQLGFFLRDKTVIQHITNIGGLSIIYAYKYKLIYDFYPIVKIYLRIKKRFKLTTKI